MAQHDYDIANQNGASLRQDLNDVLAAIISNNSGPTAPAVTEPYMFWPDTTAGVMKQRNAANTAWVSLFSFGASLLSSTNNLSDVANASTAFTNIKQAASTTTTGVVEKATPTEMNNGTADKYPDAQLVKSFIDTLSKSITGLVVTNNADDLEHDIDISAGQYGSDALDTAITKRLDAPFAAGTGNGGMVGSLPASGVVYVFLIKNNSTSNMDVYAETTDGGNPPSGWTVVKRIAVRITDASNNLQRVNVSGNGEQLIVYPYTEVIDVTLSTLSTSRIAIPASGVLSCPPLVDTELLQANARGGSAVAVIMTSLLSADITPVIDNLADFTTDTTNTRPSIIKRVRVNANRQVGVRATDASAHLYKVRVISWIEDRA